MPGIFISYRREDSVAWAGWIRERLTQRFIPPEWQIFMDIDSVIYGDDFVDAIQQAVGSCDALIAVIGPHWLTAADEHDRRRLDIPEDFVRLEIATALERKIRVIPALVAGTRMPRADELPEDLRRLTRRHAIEISHASFHPNITKLIEALEKGLTSAEHQAGIHPLSVPGKQAQASPIRGQAPVLPRAPVHKRRTLGSHAATGLIGLLGHAYVFGVAGEPRRGACRFRFF